MLLVSAAVALVVSAILVLWDPPRVASGGIRWIPAAPVTDDLPKTGPGAGVRLDTRRLS